MAIEPIGTGAAGMGFGSFGGGFSGINKYTKNNSFKPVDYSSPVYKPDTAPEARPLLGSEKSGNEDPDKKGLGKDKDSEDADIKRRFDSFECQTCKNRKYQDGSDDSGVSFQTPTRIAPSAVASKVRGHEQEHVARNQAKAKREGNEIVSQTVTLHTGICPECGRLFISGGTTRTTYRIGGSNDNRFNVGLNDSSQGKGNFFDKTA